MRLGRAVAALVGASLTLTSGHAASSSIADPRDGDPDASFSGDGLVVAEITDATDAAYAVLVDGDGTLLVTGGSARPTEPLVLARFVEDGSLDVSFGAGGVALSPPGFDVFTATDVAVDPDGRIVLAIIARRLGSTHFVGGIARFAPDGTADPTFGSGGMTLYSEVGEDVFLTALAVGGEGRIVAAGGSGEDTLVVALREDGSPDPGFADAGRLVQSFGPRRDQGVDLALDRRGRVVLAGGIYGANSTPDDGFVTRLDEGGAVDTQFADTGMALTGFGPETEALLQIAIDRDGRIVGVGYLNHSIGIDIGLFRLLPDGHHDRSFGEAGTVLTSRGDDELIGLSIAMQPDGRIVVGGRDDPATGRGRLGLWRYLPSGALDPTFGRNGATTAAIDADPVDLAIDGRGRIVAVGSVDGLRSRDLLISRVSGQRTRCQGLLVTADLSLGVGPGRHRDVVLGTPGADEIRARRGADVICAAGGDDLIDGGAGRDRCQGGRGADTLHRCEEEAP